jgi:hypothetical protein
MLLIRPSWNENCVNVWWPDVTNCADTVDLFDFISFYHGQIANPSYTAQPETNLSAIIVAHNPQFVS